MASNPVDSISSLTVHGYVPIAKTWTEGAGSRRPQLCPWAGQGEAGGEGCPRAPPEAGLQPPAHPTALAAAGPTPVDTPAHSPWTESPALEAWAQPLNRGGWRATGATGGVGRAPAPRGPAAHPARPREPLTEVEAAVPTDELEGVHQLPATQGLTGAVSSIAARGEGQEGEKRQRRLPR